MADTPQALVPTAARPTAEARDRVIAALSNAFAHDHLEVEEFERRVTVAHTSASLAEVDALVADLPAAVVPAAPAARALVPSADVREHGRTIAVMGGVERKGSWEVPRQLRVVTLMGGAQLDFREARLPPGPVDVHVTAFMGGVEVIVPPHLAVEADGVAIMGGFAHVDRAPPRGEPAASVLRIHGFAMMGGVSIELRLPGETAGQAARRRRRERRALPGRE